MKILIALMVLGFPLGVKAMEINYNHESLTISEIQSKVDFKILVPTNMPEGWTLDTKTSPDSNTIDQLSLHYMDEKDKNLMIAIHQKKSTKKSLRSGYKGEKVNLNGSTGYFKKWENVSTGGLLVWNQDGTYIEMDSQRISKGKMIKIATSMK